MTKLDDVGNNDDIDDKDVIPGNTHDRNDLIDPDVIPGDTPDTNDIRMTLLMQRTKMTLGQVILLMRIRMTKLKTEILNLMAMSLIVKMVTKKKKRRCVY